MTPGQLVLTGTGELTAAFTLPDRVPTGEVTVGAHNGDTAHDGVGAGAVQTGVVAGQERLLVSVDLHIVLTVCKILRHHIQCTGV